MRIIVDANIIFAALIRDSATRRILFHPKFEFFVPDFIFEEINENMNIISSKTGMTQEKIKELLEIIKNRALTFPYSFYRSNIKSAEEIIGKIDKKDVPYVALALSMNNDGIWSNDKHFLRQKKIKIWQTEELLGLID